MLKQVPGISSFLSHVHSNLLKRYKHRLALFLLVFAPFSSDGVLAQSSDSLKALLNEARGEQRVELLFKLSSKTRQKSMNEAIEQVQKALIIAKRLDNEDLQSRSMIRLAWFYTIVNRDTTALTYYLSALKIERRHGHQDSEASILLKLGHFYQGQSNQPKALNYFFQALRIYKGDGNKADEAETLVSIGDVYYSREKFKQAATFYQQAYRLSKGDNNYNEMAFAASGAAYAMKDQKKYDNAITYFEKALEAADNIKSKHRVHAQASILLGMSSVYQDQQLFKKAITMTKKQLHLAAANESRMLQAFGYKNLAELYQDQGNIKRSVEYFKKTISLRKILGTPYANILNELAQNYILQRQYKLAVNTVQQGLRLVRKSGSVQQKKTLLKTLIKAYSKQGSYNEALKVQNELLAVNKQIYNREKAKQIAEMQTRYETEQKEKAIVLLQQGQQRAKLLRNSLIVGLLLVLIISYLVYNRQRLKIKKNKTDMENASLKKQQLEQDIAFQNKQLTTHSLHLVQKNEVMKELKAGIAEAQNNSGDHRNKKLHNLQRLVDYSFNLDKDWDDFKHYFEKVHTGFFEILKEQYPDLTSNELRLSALVKLNLTIKEIATIMNISPDSVKTARYRLRKKLGMKTTENLTDFMMAIERKSQKPKIE